MATLENNLDTRNINHRVKQASSFLPKKYMNMATQEPAQDTLWALAQTWIQPFGLKMNSQILAVHTRKLSYIETMY